VHLIGGLLKDTVPSADGHYSDEWAPVNTYSEHLSVLLPAWFDLIDLFFVFSDFRST
jgi:hypothetical protein